MIKLIDLLEQKFKECPPATQDVDLNTKNRDSTVKNHNYGPLNTDEPGDYWEKVAEKWNTSVEKQPEHHCVVIVQHLIYPQECWSVCQVRYRMTRVF